MGYERSFIAIDDISVYYDNCKKTELSTPTMNTIQTTTSITTVIWQIFIERIYNEVKLMNENLMILSKEITDASETIREDIRKLNEVFKYRFTKIF
jgi:mannose/fructose/N-acetylgalactosamine-specific phosphotransferase system component IIB